MPRLSFIYPELLWLLAIIGLIWAVALATPRRLAPWRFWLSLGLRTTIALALILAISGVQLLLPVAQITTVFLLDASDSLTPSARAEAERFIDEALRQMPEHGRAAIVVFGAQALVERAPSTERRLGRINSLPVATRTNLAEAIQLGLALFPADSQKRLVLLSDGGENSGNAVEAARLAAARQVPIDLVDLNLEQTEAEVLVAQIQAPSRVRAGQTATVRATIESSVAQQVRVRLLSETTLLDEQTVALEPGANQVSFAVEASGSGFQRLRVQIDAERDARVQNNEAATLMQIQGPPRLLLVAAERTDALVLAEALQATNMLPEIVAPALMPPSLADLSIYDAVVLVNTPAQSLPPGAMDALSVYVRDLGKGLLMIGGDRSYGVGGYGQTPIEAALPVYMDVRNREERPDLGLIFLIDKSGSMDACHCTNPDRSDSTGMSSVRKIDLAKDAVAQAAALLTPRDTLGIVSFDSRAFQTLPPSSGVTVEQVVEMMAGVEPNGTTDVRVGLIEATELLQEVDARIKHVVLLTDGWGSTGDQTDLAEQMRAQGITLSVVAAGSGSADYLERLAFSGGGRYYATESMADLPQIFVQETITTVGNYIIERPFVPIAIGESPILAGVRELPTLYGYNGSTLKDSARLLLTTDDRQPLLATWQYGLGQSAAWLSDTRGQWSAEWLSWEGFPRFAAQLLGAILPTRGSQENSAEILVAGGETTVRVSSSEEQNLTVIASLIGSDGSRRELPLTQVGPGSYLGRMESPGPGSYLVQISGTSAERRLIQETLGMIVPYSAEYRGDQANRPLLSELASLTGGAWLEQSATAFNPVAARVMQAQEIGLPLLILALCLLPLDIALRRLLLRRSDLPQFRAMPRPERPGVAAPPQPEQDTSDTETMPPSPALDPMERLLIAKDRARRRSAADDEPRA
jgi:uncharacterized membrane protein